MRSFLSALIALSAASRVFASSGTVWTTPHDSYSSSIGVLGCKIDTNRVAYWPAPVDCTNICISLSHQDRTVKLLRIDQSGGAHDVSYDAWNYLYTGYSAVEKPAAGGPVAMQYEDVDASACADLIYTDDGKLPVSAANSMNFVAGCMAQEKSWVGSNYMMYNIMDSICSLGYDEKCSLDLNVSNQPKCPNTLGLPVKLTSQPVYNVRYPSGEVVQAATGEIVDEDVAFGKRRGGLSAGAKAGIGVGVTLAVLVSVAVVGFFWWRRGRRTRETRAGQSPVVDGLRREDSSSGAEENVVGKKMDWGVVDTRKETW